MAIGARITSTNLSGKTATVTFVPYTGSTSGNTVNLGTKTVPFNHINSHPYGVYSLYFEEYDYTYTLNIPEPEAQGVQLFVHSDKIVGSNNYGVATLNFNDFTAEVIDLDVNVNDWNNNDIEYVTESGFMYYFRGTNNNDDRLVIFTDSSNNEIERYSGTTDSFSRDTLQGRWSTAEFTDLGVLKFSDGISVYTYTWDPSTHRIDIEWDWDPVASDGTMIIKKFELGSWSYDGDGESYIVNPNDGTTTLFKTWTDGTYVRHRMNITSNFIVVETQDQTSNYRYTNLEICDLTGDILETISLTGETYNTYNHEFHGENKYTIVYYNYQNDSVAYKIIHYNGDTNTLVQTSHERGANYINNNVVGNDNYWPSRDGITNGAILLMFYNGNSSDSIGTITTYCDFMYMLNNQTSFTTYTFADNVEKSFQPWNIQMSDMIKVLCNNGDDVVSYLTITSGTTRIESMNIFKSVADGINSIWLGNKSIVQIFTNGYTSVTYKYVNAIGAVTDEISDDLNGAWGTGFVSMGEVCYIKMETLTNGNLGYFVYGNNVDFNSTTYYTNNETPDSYDSVTKELPESIFLFAEGGGTGRVLSSTGLTSQFNLPEFNNYNTRMGKDKFMIVYQDFNDNDYIKINLYDFSGTLLNSTSTTYTSWDSSWGAKDRFVVKFYDGSNHIFYMISENEITPVTIQSYDGETRINDYVWND